MKQDIQILFFLIYKNFFLSKEEKSHYVGLLPYLSSQQIKEAIKVFQDFSQEMEQVLFDNRKITQEALQKGKMTQRECKEIEDRKKESKNLEKLDNILQTL